MPFQKGHKGVAGPGRPKGIPNKIGASAKDAVLQVFELMGGVPAYKKWAAENPTEFYRIHAKLLPRDVEISGTDGGPIQTSIEVKFIGAKKDN